MHMLNQIEICTVILLHTLLSRSEASSEVSLQVVEVLKANTATDHVRQHARSGLLLRAELLVRGARGVDHERLRVADVGEVRGELECIEELHTGLVPALDAEAEHGAEAACAEVLLGVLVGGMRL